MVPEPKIVEPSSPTKPLKPDTEEVVITGSGFQELGNPVALAKHSAKEEMVERRKVKFDMANYSHLSCSEIFSGFFNQVHSTRDLEIDMVKHMHQKHEVCNSCSHMRYILLAPKSTEYDRIEYIVDLLDIFCVVSQIL